MVQVIESVNDAEPLVWGLTAAIDEGQEAGAIPFDLKEIVLI